MEAELKRQFPFALEDNGIQLESSSGNRSYIIRSWGLWYASECGTVVNELRTKGKKFADISEPASLVIKVFCNFTISVSVIKAIIYMLKM